MRLKKYTNKSLKILLLLTVMSLSACNNMVLLDPKGQIGLEQRSLILIALGLMLIVVVPAITMALIFTIKYRESNTKAAYRPNWSQSHLLEWIVWTIPIIIIIILAILTWKSTHDLDPSKPIVSNFKNINIEVIALDWKWLFIYPEQGIATINEIVFPKGIPVKFKITSNSVMNAFFIPQLGSQVYAMAGMNSTLHLIANQSGKYKGFSSNFSGHGFSGMKFTAIAVQDQAMFDTWIKKVKTSPNTLDTMEDYEKLTVPSECHVIEYFSNVKSGLFKTVIERFMNK
ncbi:ubiquinol oxidase subunit II [Candidatus Curculioniphilus buchneri]|uniref:ubiquinol oxidase subunit II n=1 Tax=Candidatus Curculioniphilus buchneri TaxID=690594 RepID=UPI00376ECD7E